MKTRVFIFVLTFPPIMYSRLSIIAISLTISVQVKLRSISILSFHPS